MRKAMGDDFETMSKAKDGIFQRGTATETERTKIAEMKGLLGVTLLQQPLKDQEENVSDDKLLRFLRGYEKNPKLAADAYLSYLDYRRDNDIDRQRQLIIGRQYEYPNSYPEYAALWKATAKGMRACYSHDKFGNLVTVTEIGELNIRKVLSLGLEQLYIEYNQCLEEWFNIKLHALSIKKNACVGRYDVINVSKFGAFQFNVACYKLLEKAALPGTHYPESSSCIASVGNGWLAILAWNNVIRPFVPARTKEKIRAVGVDFLPVLLETIEIDQLPAIWGGTKNDTPFDALFHSDLRGSIHVIVGRRDSHEVRVNVNESNMSVEWAYSLDSHTISFEVYLLQVPSNHDHVFNEHNAQRIQVSELLEVEADGEKTGRHTCQTAGTLVLRWDNTSSLMRSKSVTYTVKTNKLEE